MGIVEAAIAGSRAMLAVLALAGGTASGQVAPAGAKATAPVAEARPIVGRDRLNDVSIAGLSMSPAVRADLKLTPERIRAISEAVDAAAPDIHKLKNRRRNVFNWVRQRRANQDELDRADLALRRAEGARDAAVRAHLSEPEYRRLFGIAVQRQGIRSLTWPEVAEAVGLLPDDAKEVRAILADREPRRAELIQQLNAEIPPADLFRYERIVRQYINKEPITAGDERWTVTWWDRRRKHGAKVEAFEDEIDAKLFRVLGLIQKKRFQALMGDPIDIDAADRP